MTVAVDNPVILFLFSGAITMLPLFIGAGSAYIKISIVLTTLRSGLGQQQIPGPLLTSLMSFILSALIMWPTVNNMYLRLEPLFADETKSVTTIGSKLSNIVEPWYEFMKSHSDPEILFRFRLLACRKTNKDCKPENLLEETPSAITVVPAFLLTEVNEAFEMAFFLLVPFLVIDAFVSLLLAGLGMYMVSPVMITFPLKLLLIVHTGLFSELAEALVISYGSA